MPTRRPRSPRPPNDDQLLASDERTVHVPVMREEVLSYLNARPGGLYVDGTLGAGGHAEAILERSAPTGRVLGLDVDQEIIALAQARLAPFGERLVTANENFTRLERMARWYGFVPADGVLLDLGVSSLQLDRPERGFSFQSPGPLDMRLSQSQPITAATLVNELSEAELADLIFRFGEERRSRAVARAIVAARGSGRIETTDQLAEIVARVVPRGRIHPATRTFQALRIEVNRELEALETALRSATEILGSGGRLVVIAFHSLEDRLVKRWLADEANPCICPPDLPVCVCNRQPRLEVLTRKVVTPSADEIAGNPRSRSAKLRAARKILPNGGLEES